MKRKHIIIWAVIIISIFTASFSIIRVKKNLDGLQSFEVQNVDLSRIPDGEYFGSSRVFPVAVKVKVEINNHKISQIHILKHTNGQGAPAEIIPDKIIDAQSLKVDIISGATYSSKVILMAIEDALSNAQK